jgi:hypothetical protein
LGHRVTPVILVKRKSLSQNTVQGKDIAGKLSKGVAQECLIDESCRFQHKEIRPGVF